MFASLYFPYLFPMQTERRNMNSFFFWLTVAAAIGAMLALILRPGAIEIFIVLAPANFAFYGYRRLAHGRRHTATN